MNDEKSNAIALYASTLSATEIGLGGLLHTLHIPMTGQLLSLNQIAILSHAASSIDAKDAPTVISTIAALLKSLTPIGKKLTPMLAIAMQGLLFNIGTLVLGRAFGALLSSLWSFIQPALLYTLIFGCDIWLALEKMSSKIFPEGVFWWIIALAIFFKMALAVTISILAPRVPLSYFTRIRVPFPVQSRKKRSAWKGALFDLCRPAFVGSLGIVALFFYWVESPPEWIFFALLRPIACGYLLFALLRLLPMEKCITFLRNDSSFKKTFLQALNHLRLR